MLEPDTLADRLQFVKLDSKTRQNLRGIKSIIMRALPGALDKFYDQVRSFPKTRHFFSGQAHIDAAKSRQIAHWGTISDARFDQSYMEAATRIGEVHARVGLEPRWHIGGYALLIESMLGALLEARWPRAGLAARIGLGGGADVRQVAEEAGALVKAALIDMDYAISAYLEASETARQKVEADVLARERGTVVDRVGAGMAALATGDLTFRMSSDVPEEYRKLQEDFNGAIESLQTTMQAIDTNAQAVRTGSDEIRQASDDLARRTAQQAASLEQAAATLDGITTTVRRSAEDAGQARHMATVAKTDAERSGDVVRQTVTTMSGIEASSRQIGSIIGIIDEIAFLTNLLAVNAGVEAARAGDAGRGFAVVATEVRALAQRSAEAAKEIKELISASGRQVTTGVKLVGETGKALDRIVEQVSRLNVLVTDIAISSANQATGLNEVNDAVNQMDQVTQQNAAMVEQSAAASRSMANEAEDLARLVEQFQTGHSQAFQTASRTGPAPAASLWQDEESSAYMPAAASRSAAGGNVLSFPAAKGADGWDEF
ncbi:methyl-accepting chemotaxis protein [Gluconacetobacter diazotrophicus]|uniref:Putative chemoreceptor mcpA (Methyl-accepting chemotaxis protein) n=1 Tax=Gluconacetobacter diazotrophicus (strain ATCC 49037 / DSM 5601 / CCUG 37298 / CIP 103539 / LMG 7603 / PAl5) TaxID=272568 RepID=A9HJC8_GLUDA|nr:globin-coupled sensor protein [Gluconacetobacter diazotrophicus]CAP55890.1 putative chemoreceptor mcpA (Methyl-accepting chemotaxis protein) [Gluconacetobacter diazotrophicus PA1 5]